MTYPSTTNLLGSGGAGPDPNGHLAFVGGNQYN